MCTPQGIIEHLGCMVFDEAVKAVTTAGKYVCHYRTNLLNLQREMTTLEVHRKIIEREVKEAHDRGEEIEEDVLKWQTDVDTVKNDVQNLAGQSTDEAQMHCFACSRPNIKWRYRLSKQAEEKIEDVKKLAQESHFDKISHPKPPPPELEFPSAENYVHLDSRTPILEAIVGALKDPNVKMIGVHGLGGVGKTTLVEKVAKKMLDDGTFKQVPLAVVSKVLNVKEIQKKLADKLNLELKATADENAIAIQLWNKFTNGEKYLVILDDIWEKVDLKAIGIPIADGTKGCKVVLTSRNGDLLRIRMKADRNFPIEELPEEEAWDLFKKKVGSTIESWPEIDSLARQVCRKCKGLPVAINALGAALEDKPVHVWKNALDKLEKHMLTQIEGIDPSVWVILSLSYEMLQSLDAQSCFLLCCLFAEDAEIPINELVRHCMARSLLAQNPDTFDAARTAVRTVVDVLKSASLLSTDDYETVVKIHDVIRDVGISIAHMEEDKKEAFLIRHGVARWPRNPKKEPLYSTISISFKDIKKLPDGLEYPQLKTLIVDNCKLSDIQVPENFFNGMTQLTVLTITQMRMRQLPSSLANLKNLQMLYLKECELDDIAILKDLKNNLEVLNLRGSSIEALPPEIGQLTSLRVLDLQDCDELMVIPQSVISNLTSLEESYFPQNFFKWKATTDKRQDTSRRENVTLEDFRGLLSTSQLSTLHVYVPDVMLLPKEDLIFENLKGFKISVGSEIKTSEEISARCMLNLEGIQLRNEFISLVDKAEVVVLKNIEGLKKVFCDRGVENRFLDLKYLKVTSCVEDLEYLLGEPKEFVQSQHRLRPFNNLTVLIIEKCKSKYLFSPTTAEGLVHLEELEVRSCINMEGIVAFEGRNDKGEFTSEVKFSKLKQLKLKDLPNLLSFYAQKEKMEAIMGSSSSCAQPLFSEKVIFPVLERLTIDGLSNIIKIWDKQLVAVWQEQGSFCQLTSVNVNKCEKLMHVFPSNMHPLLKNLEELEVDECETLKGIAEFEGERDEDAVRNEVASPAREHLGMVGVTEILDNQSLPKPREEVESLCRPMNNDDIIVFPRLKDVSLWSLPQLKSFYSETQGFFSHKVAFPVLERLLFWSLDKITRIWDNQPLSELEKKAKSFCQLIRIVVYDCKQLEYVLPSYMLPQLENLEELIIESCRKMEVIISNNPQEKEATNNNDAIRFPQLKTLQLKHLPNLKSFICSDETQLLFSNKVAFPVLERLIFWSLDKITRIWDNQPLSGPEKEAKSFSKLQNISVYCCNQLEYVLPFYLLPQLKNILQELYIKRCRKMEVIISNNLKEKEATNNNDTIRFPRLNKVELEKLPNLKSFICSDETQLLFSNKATFPVLEHLGFLNLDKITRIWDNKPLSEPEKEAKSFSELKIINVGGCEHLEYVLPFYMLPQLKNLQKLSIRNCMRVEVIISNNSKEKEATNNNDTIQFPQLNTLQLEDLPNFKSFICCETQLFFSIKVIFPVLKKLSIRKMNKIIEIWDKQSTAVLEEQGFFCQLTDLDVSECEKLMHVFHSKMHLPLKNLKALRVSDCPTMEGIVEFEGEIDEDGLRNEVCFSELSSLELSSLPNLQSFCAKLGKAGTTEGNSTIHALPLFNGKVIFPVLKKLSIRRMNKIIEICDKQSTAVLEEQGFFCQLTDLDVSECEKLMHVFHSKMHLPIKNLKVLRVSDCPTMEGIFEFEGDIEEDELRNELCFSKLSSLELSGLANLESFCTKLEKAGTTEGNSIIHALSLFNRKVVFPILKTLKFKGLHKITRIWDNQPLSEPEKKAKSFSELQYIGVGGCEHLEYVLPFYMLPQLKDLQELRIRDCRKMEVIISNNPKEKEATNNNDIIQFIQLKTLELDDLPNFKSFICCETQLFFPNKVIFPVLRELSIRKMHKIIEIWDKKSIAVLEEQGSFSQLTDLDVSECEKLMHVFPSKMHSLLKNLKELCVSDCPTMEGIVEFEGEIDEDGLRNELCFSKLSSLELSGLANLESFCTKLEKAGTTEGNSIIHALPLFNRKVAFPVLKTLKFNNLSKITRIWDEQPLSKQEKEAKSFSKLMVIDVGGCDQLDYVLPSYMLPQLKNILQQLLIWNCKKMEVIISNNPEEKEATNNNDTIRFPQLREVFLASLPNLKSFIYSETQLFFSNKDVFPVLKYIELLPEGTLEFLRNETSTKKSSCSNPRPKPKRYRRHPPRTLLPEGEINSVVQLDGSGDGVTQFQSVEEGDSATSSTHILPQASGSESALTLPALEEIDHLDANLQIFRIGTCPQRPKPECHRRQPQRPKPKHNRRHPPRPLLQEGEINSVIQSDESGVGVVP